MLFDVLLDGWDVLFPWITNGQTSAMNRRQIKKILLHRGPMLLVDRVVSFNLQTQTVVAELDVRPRHLRGHDWAFPGCHSFEALGQAAILLFAYLNPTVFSQSTPIFKRIRKGDMNAMVSAGDTLRLEASLVETRPPFAFFTGTAFVGTTPVASVVRLVLAIIPNQTT